MPLSNTPEIITLEAVGRFRLWQGAGTTGTAVGGYTGNTTLGGAFSNIDGYSRRSRVRWDSPTFAGFTLSTSTWCGRR